MPRARRISDFHPELGLPEVRKLWQTEGLFSDHYLKTKITRNAWWPNDSEAEPVWRFCKELYEKRYVACARNNEQFTRQELLDKILERLGFAWTDNLSLPETQQHLEPDYILYASAAEKEAVIDRSSVERYRSAIAIVEAKKVNHPLSQISRTQLRYPHQQIRDYLNEAQTLGWGMLTSGNEWRLYARDARPSHFFALDFSATIESLETFKYFIALFGPAAFVRDAQGRCRLDEVRESAMAAQVELEEDLRLRVFTILEILANGFFSRAENRITESDLPLLYDRCLIFLYRLLFVLYSEGRELLPVDRVDRKYLKDFSLTLLQVPLRNFSEYDSPHLTRLHDRIASLFHLINGTNEKLNKAYSVPRYNGGLFDPVRYPELERWRVSDAALADVLRGLMFNPPPERGQPSLPVETVDFGDLRVQQLGSIYEGLMEHHFHRDTTTLKLVADKAERRQTGTYYTPDYIVKYIVDQTIRPLLDEIEANEPVKNATAASRQDSSFADAVLKLNMCDPAMGSGHFLVEATTFLADHIVYHPTTKFQAAKEKGVPQEQIEIAYWRRRVVESCIYGVDLNPLAVELAKLSLWLSTIASDQPLNFLDHHLCCGNSLIGARVEQLGALPERKKPRRTSQPTAMQTRLSFGPDFQRVISETIRQIHSIEGKASADVEAVKEKEKRWQEKVLPALAPYKAVADLWTSTFFGNALDEETYLAQAQKILNGKKVDNEPARSHRFFHWDLEFPEVFFNDDGTQRTNRGFDVFIGNPPYVEFKRLDNVTKGPLESLYESARGKYDIFVPFIERALELTRQGGNVSYICPSMFMMRDYGTSLRAYILTHATISVIVDFTDYQVFAGATNFPIIIVLRKGLPVHNVFPYIVFAKGLRLAPSEIARRLSDSRSDSHRTIEVPQDRLDSAPWFLQRFDNESLLTKIASISIPLIDMCSQIYEGIASGKDEVFYIPDAVKTSEKLEEHIVHRLLKGEDCKRYCLSWSGFWVIYPYDVDDAVFDENVLEKKFPNAWCYLKQHRELLKGRRYFDASSKAWYELWCQRKRRYFNRPKILTPEISDRNNFALDSDGYFANTKVYGILLKESYSISATYYVLALLNSRVLEFIHHGASVSKAGGFYAYKTQFLSDLPIRRVEFTTPTKQRGTLLMKAKQLVEKAENDEVLRFVEEQLATEPERADVVHDLLGFLAEEMMRLNTEKCVAARGFIVDLKDFHGIDARSMNPKTKLDEFWKLEAPEVFAHLRGNKIRLKESDDEKIRGRFSKAKSTLVLLDAQIALTDRLIDQIVYQLYRLTPDEIKIVDGTSKAKAEKAKNGNQ